MAKVQVLASGKWKFLKADSKAKVGSAKSGKKSTSKGGRKVTRMKSVFIAATIGVLAALAIPFFENLNPANRARGYLRGLTRNVTGYDFETQQFTADHLLKFWAPIGLGVGGSMIASDAGLNRTLSVKLRGVPLLNRIRV